jgi:hypothetical protein
LENIESIDEIIEPKNKFNNIDKIDFNGFITGLSGVIGYTSLAFFTQNPNFYLNSSLSVFTIIKSFKGNNISHQEEIYALLKNANTYLILIIFEFLSNPEIDFLEKYNMTIEEFIGNEEILNEFDNIFLNLINDKKLYFSHSIHIDILDENDLKKIKFYTLYYQNLNTILNQYSITIELNKFFNLLSKSIKYEWNKQEHILHYNNIYKLDYVERKNKLPDNPFKDEVKINQEDSILNTLKLRKINLEAENNDLRKEINSLGYDIEICKINIKKKENSIESNNIEIKNIVNELNNSEQ